MCEHFKQMLLLKSCINIFKMYNSHHLFVWLLIISTSALAL